MCVSGYGAYIQWDAIVLTIQGISIFSEILDLTSQGISIFSGVLPFLLIKELVYSVGYYCPYYSRN